VFALQKHAKDAKREGLCGKFSLIAVNYGKLRFHFFQGGEFGFRVSGFEFFENWDVSNVCLSQVVGVEGNHC
jgi:hypothetical protein